MSATADLWSDGEGRRGEAEEGEGAEGVAGEEGPGGKSCVDPRCIDTVQRYILLGMRLAGVYSDALALTSRSCDKPAWMVTSRWRLTLGSIWCVFANIVHFLCAARFLPSLLDPERRSRIGYMQIIVMYISLLTFLCNLATLRLSRKVLPFFAFLTELHQYCMGSAIASSAKTLIKVSLVKSALCLASVIAMVVYSSEFSVALHWYTAPFEDLTGSWKIVWEVVLCPLLFINCVSYVALGYLFVLMAYGLTRDLSAFNSDLRGFLEDRQDAIQARDLEDRRRHLERICSLVERTNAMMAHHLAATYVTAYPVLLLLVWALAKSSQDLESCVFLVGCAWITFLLTCVTTVFSALVNAKAHECRSDLLRVRLDNASEKTIHIMTLFVARLSGPSIGFSLYGLFTIDMPAILTLLGTLIAYVVVVLQFQPSPSPCDCPLSTPLPLNWTLTTP